MVGEAFATDLGRAVPLPNRMNQLDAVTVHHPQEGGRRQEQQGPLPVSLELPKQPGALGQVGKQRLVISRQPAIERSVADPLQGVQHPQGHHLAPMVITEGTRADCQETSLLIDSLSAQALLADKAYDTDALIAQALAQNMQVVIPPRKNRKQKREYDEYLYTLRHLVENAFLYLKRWRSIATRYAKNAESFLAAVQIRAAFLWASIS